MKILFSPIFLATMGVSAQAVFLIAVAVLACLLGAEIAGICILASKIRRAQKQRASGSDEAEYRHYGAGIVLLASGVGQTGYTVLSILAVLTVLAALVFVVLLFYARALGLDFVSSKQKAAKKAQVYAEPARAQEPVQTPAPVMEEGEWQEAFDEPVDEPVEIAAQDADSEADALDGAFAEEEEAEIVLADGAETAVPEITEELVLEEPAEEAAVEEAEVVEAETVEAEVVEAEEPAVEEVPAEEEPVEAPVQILPVAEVAPAPVESAVAMPAEAAESAASNQPYKVVEKVVTETVKEIYKETPQAAPAAPQNGGLSESVVEKLVDLLDYELRTRHELERAEAEKRAAENGSAQAFATVDPDEDDEDEDDIDDIDDAATEGDDDRDDEENDTDGDHFTGNERIIGFDEKTGYYIVAHYRKSFEAKLIQSRPNIKQYYSELKNALLAYKGTKNRISWTADSFHNGRTPIAKINVKTRILELYLALDPASLEGTVYRGKDVGGKKKYADTPFQYKIRTPRKFKWALELIQRVCEEKGLSPIDIEKIDYEAQYPFDTTENLVERKLIKEYIREEKPATSFELDPDHVPEVPEEDESVIPANANFSWEFDNERMVETEPDPIPEPEPEEEPEVEPEPVAEPQPEAESAPAAPAAEIYKETVKVTEMRYTERYYADGSVAEQTVSVSEPIEVLAEPVIELDSEEAVEEPAQEPEQEAIEQTEAEEVADEEATEEAEEERFFEDESTTEHEVIFADDSSYGDGVEYAPIVVEAPTEEEESEEEPAEEEAAQAEEPPAEEQKPDEADAEETPAEEAVESFAEEEEAFFDTDLEEIPYEEAPFEEIDPEEEVIYEDEIYEEAYEEGEAEEIYEEAYEEGEAEELYEEEAYEEGEAEEIYEEEAYEEGEAEEIYEEEAYEEGEAEEIYEEVYEEGEAEEIYEEAYEEGEAEEIYEEAYEEGETEEIYEEVYEEVYEEEAYEEVYGEEAYEELPEESAEQSFNPSVAVIDICSVEDAYRAGEVISLDTLKERNLVLAGVSVLKIYASGELGKAFTVEAHQFTMDAIKAISDAHGDVIMVR